MPITRRSARLASIALGMLALLVLLPAFAVAQDGPQVTWHTYDVTVQVNEDGTLRVTESIVIDFNGSFRQGHRTIPMSRIESIDDVDVSVGVGSGDVSPSTQEEGGYSGEPGTYQVSREGDDLVIDYGFKRTSSDRSDSVRTVVISYTAHGAIRDYPDAEPAEQQVRWTAISSDVTATGPVESASATIIFPEPVSSDSLAIDPEATTVEGDRIIWEAESLEDGDSLRVAVAFPPITSATAPAWQAEADKYEGRQEHLGAINLIVALVALVTWVITILFMVVRGVRDPEVGLVADIIPNPPDDLPAPLVGTLVDESVDTKDVMAGLLDLERQGFIRISSRDKGGIDAKYKIELLRPLSEANAWDKPMLEGLFGKSGKVGKDINLKTRMKQLREKSFSEISKAYEEELFTRGFFLERPHSTRMRWVRNLFLIVLATAIVLAAVSWWANTISGWVAVPLVISVIGLIVGGILTTKAAVKTTEGAIVAAKWKAYGRYVKDLKKGPQPERFFAELEHSLPWAVALGFDSSWASLADEMTTTTTTSTRDRKRGRGVSPVFVGIPDGGRSGGSSSRGDSGSGGGGGGLQGASAATLAAIGGGSAGMLAMLNDAAASFNSGASSGSGGSGGFSGSSSVGSSGGGGHSFS